MNRDSRNIGGWPSIYGTFPMAFGKVAAVPSELRQHMSAETGQVLGHVRGALVSELLRRELRHCMSKGRNSPKLHGIARRGGRRQ